MKSAKRIALFLPVLLGLVSTAMAAAPDCASTDEALAYWRPVRADVESPPLPVDHLAMALVPCLGSPDPELRDQIGYELFSHWLREDKLSDPTRAELRVALGHGLKDDNVLQRSFSALILAELMRSDAGRPFMSARDREALLVAGAAALRSETDYRGLEPETGWVHPVAHLADLLWRFALHPETVAKDAASILDAVDSQIAPGGVAYRFNESDRLARSISTLIRRGLLEPAVVTAWFDGFQKPRSMTSWSEAFKTPAGMAELHNTKLFLRALSDQLAEDDIDPAIADALNALVKGFTLFI